MTEREPFQRAERELDRVEEIERTKMQNRTRVIVDAAENLAQRVRVEMKLEVGEPAVLRFERELDALTALVEAVGLPAPMWSSTPPTKPGDYFVCDSRAGAKPFVTSVRSTLAPNHHGALVFTDQRGMTTPVSARGFSWYSEAIVAPERPS